MRRDVLGFSLIELAVSLAVASAVGLVMWKLLPAARQAGEGQPVARQLAMAQAALEGYALGKHRLPCPDTDNNGTENCIDAASVRVTMGQLPWRDLGLNQDFAGLRYGVSRGAALPIDNDLAAQAMVRQTPFLPSPYSSSVVNGLDLCVALRRAAGSPFAAGTLTAGGVASAYALAHPGADGRFQGLNTAGFDLPGKAVALEYDDTVVAAGLAELSGRLACPTRLGEANAAARAAYAAYDIDRGAAQFKEFRDFAEQVRTTNHNFAIASVSLATVDVAIAGAGFATSMAIAANSVGVGAGVVAVALIPVVASAAALVAASVGLASATVAKAKAIAQAEGAATLKVNSAAALVAAGAAAVTADAKGLNP